MKARLRFWLAMLDLAHALRLPRSFYLWIVERASKATDWGPGVPNRDGEPW